jgi:hypothetical protein
MRIDFFIVVSKVAFGEKNPKSSKLNLRDGDLQLLLESQVVPEVGLQVGFQGL